MKKKSNRPSRKRRIISCQQSQGRRPGTRKSSKRAAENLSSLEIQKFQTLPYGGFKNTTLQLIAENNKEEERKLQQSKGSQIFLTTQHIQSGPPDTHIQEYQNIRKLFQKTLDEKRNMSNSNKKNVTKEVEKSKLTKQSSFLKRVQNFQSKTNRSKRRNNITNMDGSYIQSEDLSNNDLEDISDSKNDLGSNKFSKMKQNKQTSAAAQSPLGNSRAQAMRRTRVIQIQKQRLITNSKTLKNATRKASPQGGPSEQGLWRGTHISSHLDERPNSKFSFNNEIQVLSNGAQKEIKSRNYRNEDLEETPINQITTENLQKSEFEKSMKSDCNEVGQGKKPIPVKIGKDQAAENDVKHLLPGSSIADDVSQSQMLSNAGRQNSAQHSKTKLNSIYKSAHSIQPNTTKQATAAPSPLALDMAKMADPKAANNGENYTLCNQVIKKQNQANRSVGARTPNDYSQVTQFGNQKDILNITTQGNVMDQSNPSMARSIKKRSKTPKTTFHAKDDLQQKHFQFLSTFESKKDVYLRKYYESQQKIQLRNRIMLQREHALQLREQEQFREEYENAHQAYYEQMENMRHIEQIEKMQSMIKNQAILSKYQSQAMNVNRSISCQLSGDGAGMDHRKSIDAARSRAYQYLSEIQTNFDKFEQNRLFMESRKSYSSQSRREHDNQQQQNMDIDDYNDRLQGKNKRDVIQQSFGSENYRYKKNLSIIGLDLGESSNHFESNPNLNRTDRRQNNQECSNTEGTVATPQIHGMSPVIKFPENPFQSLDSQKIIITTQEDFSKMNFDPTKHTLIMVDENFNVIDQNNKKEAGDKSRQVVKPSQIAAQRHSWGEVQKSGITNSFDTVEDQHLGIGGNAAKGIFNSHISVDLSSNQRDREQHIERDEDAEHKIEQNAPRPSRSISGRTRQIKLQKYPKGMVINQIHQNLDLMSTYNDNEHEGYPILQSAKLYNTVKTIEGEARSNKSSICGGSRLSNQRDERQEFILQSGLIGKQMGTFHKRSKSTKNIYKRVNLSNFQGQQRGMSPHIHKSIRMPQNQEQIQQHQLQRVLQQLNLQQQSHNNRVFRGRPSLWHQKQELIEKLLHDGQLNRESRRQTIQQYQQEAEKNGLRQQRKNIQIKIKGRNGSNQGSIVAQGAPIPTHVSNVSRVHRLQNLQQKALLDQEHKQLEAAQHQADKQDKAKQQTLDSERSKVSKDIQLMVQGYSPKNRSRQLWHKRNSQSIKDQNGKLIVIPQLTGEGQLPKDANAQKDREMRMKLNEMIQQGKMIELAKVTTETAGSHHKESQPVRSNPISQIMMEGSPNIQQENLKIFVIQSAAQKTPTDKPFTDRNQANGDVGCTKRLNSPVNNIGPGDSQRPLEGTNQQVQQMKNTPPVIFIQTSTLMNSSAISKDFAAGTFPAKNSDENPDENWQKHTAAVPFVDIHGRRQTSSTKKQQYTLSHSPPIIQHKTNKAKVSSYMQANDNPSLIIHNMQERRVKTNLPSRQHLLQDPKQVPRINFRVEVSSKQQKDGPQTLDSLEFNQAKKGEKTNDINPDYGCVKK